jgi:RNA polymerase sigma-70 factor (ECF subfamily)
MKDKIDNLVCRAKKRDPDAFTLLMDGQVQGMYKIAISILKNDEDAADAIQETILTCWEKLDTLKENRYFKTWMTRILINHCYTILKQNSKSVCMEELPETPTEFDSHDFEWQEALSTLNDNYRLIVVLYYAQGFKTKEIAGILKIPENTVRTRLDRARAQLEKYYKE